MRIGVAFNLDNETLLPFISNQNDKDLITNYCKNNVAPAVNTLILSFLKAGQFVRVFTLARENFIIRTDQLEIYAVKEYNEYPIKYLWGVFKNANLLRELMRNRFSDLNVLHAHWTYEYAYAASFYTDEIPVFCTIRDIASYIWSIESFKNKITWIFKWYMNNLVFKNKKIHFVANSYYTATIIKRKYNITTPIIPNSIKDSFILKGEHEIPHNFRILCISSSNDKRKNVVTLLKAYQLFKKKYPSTELQIIGAPFVSGNNTIEKWREKGLLDSVELVGAIPHSKLFLYIDKCSVFVTPSLEETFGNTLIESIARKVPVIAGEKSGAVPYVLHNGKAGYLCDVSKPLNVFNLLEYVYQNPDKAQQKASNAFDILISEYSENIVSKRYLELYSKPS